MGQKNVVPIFVLIGICLLAFFAGEQAQTNQAGPIIAGDTAWMIAATALVLFMTPGLSFFYGGMVRTGHVISTMLQSYICMGVVSVLWVVVAFSLAFGESLGGLLGNPLTYFMFRGVGGATDFLLAPTIPFLIFALFQLKFAVITPALITGAFAERVNFKSFVLFSSLFLIFVYAPLAHWTWHPEGLLRTWGVLDFAGGTVVHMSAGFAALAGAMFFGPRKGLNAGSLKHANIPFIILGTGMLWFGWFGFNAGSSLAANDVAALAFATTNTASGSAALAWMAYDLMRGRKPSAVGFCIGAVVGLVAITPAAGFVSVPASIIIGTLSAFASHAVLDLKGRIGLDDTLDVFACHGVGGMMGMIFTAVFAKDVGLVFGHTETFVKHLVALGGVAGFSFFASYVIYIVVNQIIPMRVPEADEFDGLDYSQHGEGDDLSLSVLGVKARDPHEELFSFENSASDPVSGNTFPGTSPRSISML